MRMYRNGSRLAHLVVSVVSRWVVPRQRVAMVCQGALEALVTVVITGKVGFSALGTDPRSPMMNVTTGDTMTLSFTVSPQATVREVPLQGIVMDGIAPFEMCTGDFALQFSSGLHFHLGPPPVAIDGTVGSFYFSLMKSRPVLDGAWVSTAPDMGQKGLPLELHGAPPKEIYTGVFELRYDRNTFPSLDIPKSFGTYSGLLPAPHHLPTTSPLSGVARTTGDRRVELAWRPRA